MTNPNSQPDFSDPDVINAILSSHPDLTGVSANTISFLAEVNNDAMQLAEKETQVFDYIAQWMPSINELRNLVQFIPVETPTLPDLLAVLDTCRPDVKEEGAQAEIDYTIELSSILADIASHIQYPGELDTSSADLKNSIVNSNLLSDVEKDILIATCNKLLSNE